MINSQSILNPLFINKWQKEIKKIMNLEDPEVWNYQTLNYFEESSYQDFEVDGKRYYLFQVGYKVNFEVSGTGKTISVYLIILNITYGLVLNILV